MPAVSSFPWFRAVTLREAIALHRENPQSGAADPDPALAQRWLETCAKGDPEKFKARLAWDDLTPEEVPHLGAAAPAQAPPVWVELLESALLHLREGNSLPENIRERYREERRGVPYCEIWDAFALAGLDRLPHGLDFPETGWFLSRRLAPLAAPVFHGEFEIFRNHYEGGRDAYEVWLERTRAGGCREIMEAFPVLARGLSTVTLTAVETLTDLAARLEADRSALEAMFGPLGNPEGIDPGLSDRHYEGRQVARVRFNGGRSLIYKAKSVDLDEAFQRLLGVLRREGGIPLPEPLRILRRDGYGWVEFVEQVNFTEVADVEEYFRRGGGLLALVYALEGRDFIMDNVIARLQGPAAIDAEAALQPLCLPGGAEKMDREVLLEQLLKGRDFSVLDTGLIPLWMPGGNGYYDMSGLGGQSGYSSSLVQEVWEHTGTGAVSCVRRPVAVEPEKNRVELRGVTQSAERYADQIEDGFIRVYRGILSRKREILDELETWQGCRLRFLLRPTNTYGQMLKRTLSTEFLTSGVRAGIESEVLCRPFIQSPVPPPIADFLREEVAALQRWDIPCFHLEAGVADHPYYLASPLSMAKDRIGRMDEPDLSKQCRVLHTSLTLHPRPDLGGAGKPHDPFPDLTLERLREDPAWEIPDAPVLDQVRAIAEILFRDAAAGRGPKTALLYEGLPGPAILFAALGKVTGEARYLERAAALTEDWLLEAYSPDFRQASRELPVGAADGLASLPYTCWVLSRLLDRTDLMDRAAEMAEAVPGSRLSGDQALDVFSGAAGAVMVYSALAQQNTAGQATFLERARLGMGRLLETAEVRPDGGLTWPAGGEHYLGFGHGAAGIGAALLRAGGLTGSPEALAAGKAALQMVAGWGQEEKGWPHLVREQEPVFQRMESLCHGTPGLAIAFADAVQSGQWEDYGVLQQLRRRLGQLEPHPIDTVCCGNAGRLEALQTLGSGHPALASLLRIMVKRREPLGLFRTDFRRSDIYCCPPGFFRGLSGIGYQLLRLIRPRDLPRVAAFR